MSIADKDGFHARLWRGERMCLVSPGVQSATTAERLNEIRKELTEVVGARPLTESEIAAVRSNLVLGMAGGWEWRLDDPGEVAFTSVYAEDSHEDSEGSNILNGESSESSGEPEPSAVEVL